MSHYMLTLEKEILNELGAEIYADYDRYLYREGKSMGSNPRDPFVLMAKEVFFEKDALIGYDSTEQLAAAKGKLLMARDFLSKNS